MILLCGPLSDPVLCYFAAYLSTKGVDFLLLDQRHFSREVQLSYVLMETSVKGFFDYGQWHVDLGKISGVLVRWETEEDIIPQFGISKEQLRVASSRLYQHLAILLDTLPCVVANRPSAILSNRSKPYQLGLIREWGFDIPSTLVTNNPLEAEKFYRDHGGNVIVKSLGRTRSIVRKLSENDLPRLSLITICPIQLQEFIYGTNIRVHVMGEKIFATEIATNAVDYRYTGELGFHCNMSSIELPREVAKRCIGLTRSLGLHFAGIDLYRLSNGQWGCFEVNTSPAFTWFEAQTRQPLCLTLASQLG
jgi:hypothetical protein